VKGWGVGEWKERKGRGERKPRATIYTHLRAVTEGGVEVPMIAVCVCVCMYAEGWVGS
jgi:hypothetical protein